MKLLKSKSLRSFCLWGCCALFGLALLGCKSARYADPNPPAAFVFPGEAPPAGPVTSGVSTATATPVAAPAANPTPGTNSIALVPLPTTGFGTPTIVLKAGDLLTITYNDIPPPGIPEARQRVGEDGKITLHLNVTVLAAGKTARQLEQEIRSEYVPKYYNYLTVSVKTEERYYYVGGEVKIGSRQPYLGEMTVLRAIDTAGGFTDFANRKTIELRRANGQKFKVNWYNAIKDAKLDLEVFPNDQIIVHKRLL
jgi:protein involved in polysaccharide export with SLBB domain